MLILPHRLRIILWNEIEQGKGNISTTFMEQHRYLFALQIVYLINIYET